jgi:hypothetical protein
MDECERMGRLEPYTREANANDAGDLNRNTIEKENCRMEWMRTELGENWAMEVGELRLGTAGDLDSKVGRAMERRRAGPWAAMRAWEYRVNCASGDDPKR